MDEGVQRMGGYRRKACPVACADLGVETKDRLVAPGEPVEDEVAADEDGGPGDEELGIMFQSVYAAIPEADVAAKSPATNRNFLYK